MVITNQDRVGKAMELLRVGLAPFVEREFKSFHQAHAADAGVKSLPTAKCVVLVGNKISPGNPVTKADGTVVRTRWGELAYQLGGKTAFARVEADDEKATNPGDVLRELFKEYGPCLILIDE